MISLETSAPASTMILGEHAVVQGHPALVAALTPRLRIHWQSRADDQLRIESALGNLTSRWHTLSVAQCPELKWVITALLSQRPALEHSGWTLSIDSDIDPTQGLGSSAALVAALVSGLAWLTRGPTDTESLFQTGLTLIHQLQGRGSGADLAASLSGGLVKFMPGTPPKIERVSAPLALTLAYSGYKTPTAEVLEWVDAQWAALRPVQDGLYQQMGQATQAAFEALTQDRLDDFFRLVRHYQGLMHALGVSDARLSELVWDLQQRWPASKISGSGLGDCVLGIGLSKHAQTTGDPVWPLSEQGVQIKPAENGELLP
ncbi:mevalonate kinase [Thiomicrospira sp. WB1]|uniref:mevalonate kinase family protein n=1 Tax=Thiomicrospira sp. WB1 TaxID=1685380 RepID=UPI0007483492|nr:hypothetical protein [Thiomicrospira sp. WB1]KUJ71769.1 hypothetical protein AVO41_04700 [Thiomicrospira sp. WB1]